MRGNQAKESNMEPSPAVANILCCLTLLTGESSLNSGGTFIPDSPYR